MPTRSRRRSRAGRTRLAALWPSSRKRNASPTSRPSAAARASRSCTWLSIVRRSACWSDDTRAWIAARTGTAGRVRVERIACCRVIRLLLRPRPRGRRDRTREGRQETRVRVREKVLTTAPRLEAYLQAEPPARRTPPGHRHLPARPTCATGAGVMARNAAGRMGPPPRSFAAEAHPLLHGPDPGRIHRIQGRGARIAPHGELASDRPHRAPTCLQTAAAERLKRKERHRELDRKSP